MRITYGGQAVLEGVMMRGVSTWSVAVRNPEAQIEVRSEPIVSWAKRHRAFRLPVIRGVVIWRVAPGAIAVRQFDSFSASVRRKLSVNSPRSRNEGRNSSGALTTSSSKGRSGPAGADGIVGGGIAGASSGTGRVGPGMTPGTSGPRIGASGPGDPRSLPFLALVLVHPLQAINCRSERESWWRLPPNRLAWLSLAVLVAAQWWAISWDPLARLLGTIELSAGDWLLVALAVTWPVLTLEGVKWRRRRAGSCA